MKNKIKGFLKSKSMQNSGWIVGQQIFQMILQLIVGVMTARYLGPSNYGSLNYTASFVTFCTCFATLGMEGVIIKKFIEHPEKEGEYLGSALVMRFISSTISIIGVSVVVYILNPDEPIKLLLVFLQSFQLTFKAAQIIDSWFQRYLKSKYVSIGKAVACIIVSAYKIFLLATAKNIVWFAVSNALTDGVIALIEYYFYVNVKGPKLKFSLSTGKEILQESYHFIISGIMVAMYGQMDRIMIGQMLSDMDVGLYTTATAICGMWIFVPDAIITSFQPSIMVLKQNGKQSLYIRRLEQLYSGIIWLCIAVSTVVAIMASFIISVLYGKAYLGAVQTLQIAIWYETFAMIGNARGIWILCENKNKYVKYYLSIGAVTNLILNAIMIPVWGINGAAVATLVTQIITSIVAPMFFKETRHHTKIVLDAFLLRWYWRKKDNLYNRSR